MCLMMQNFLALLVCFAFGFTHASLFHNEENNDIRYYYHKLGQGNDTTPNTCNECKLIVSELKNVINDSAKLERVKFVLKEMCRLVGGSREQECSNLVDRLYLLLRALGPYLGSPEQFCSDLHLCKSEVPIGSRVILYLFRFMVRSSKINKANDLLCDECVFAATELNSLLRNVEVQQELKREMQEICQIMSSVKQKCDQYVEEYFPFLLQFLQSLVSNPQHFCSQLKLCSGNKKSGASGTSNPAPKTFSKIKTYENKLSYKKKFATAISQRETEQTQKVQNAACVLCKYGCQSVAEELKKNREIISARLSKYICNALPRVMAPNCLDFARIYASSIVVMVIDEYATNELCVQFGFCSKKSLGALPAVNSTGFRAAVCDACHTTAQFISYEFKQQALQQQVITTVKQDVCPLLPGDLANQCLDTVDQYVPMIMQHIADVVSGQNFCKLVGLCRQNT